MTKTTKESDLEERLIHGAVEGIATEIAINAILPGAGLAANTLRGVKGLKKVAKVAGKGAIKESIKALDDENDTQDKVEELSGDFAIELLSRTAGRG